MSQVSSAINRRTNHRSTSERPGEKEMPTSTDRIPVIFQTTQCRSRQLTELPTEKERRKLATLNACPSKEVESSDGNVCCTDQDEDKTSKKLEAVDGSAGSNRKSREGMLSNSEVENRIPLHPQDRSNSFLIESFESFQDSQEQNAVNKVGVDDKYISDVVLTEGQGLYQTSFDKSKPVNDSNCEEVNDYSNPRSVESLDMECHESGDDTVIFVKEKPQGEKRRLENKYDGSFLAAKLHKAKSGGEVHFIPVGEPLKMFLERHPLIQGLYLNRGKRDTKRKLVSLARQKTAIDIGSWKRGSNIHERNRLDDAF